MNTPTSTRMAPAASTLLLAVALLAAGAVAEAGNPYAATYCTANDRIFWFVHASDTHIGMRGTTDTTRLEWLVSTARPVITPSFIVLTGDLTDSTNGSWLGYPNGPYQAEWDAYKGIVDRAGPSVIYDLPGNHDAYNDPTFAYYRANAVQGRASGGTATQISWTRTFPFGTYHFLGVNSADNTGAPFSLSWPWGDYAGLDPTELAFISQQLTAHHDADLTFVFGHHPLTDTGVADDTWLYYGYDAFFDLLGTHAASLYNYGHTHRASEALFTGDSRSGQMPGGGVHYYNVAALGKSAASNFSVVAVDCNGVSSVTQSYDTVAPWPVVLITAPIDNRIGASGNPYAYSVPNGTANPIRALVFDTATAPQVSYRVDGGPWRPMTRVAANPALWEAVWNASAVAAADHTIEVQAVGSSTRSNTVTISVTGGPVNQPPLAVTDTYSTPQGTTLDVAAPGVLANDTDAEGDALTAELRADAGHGTVSLWATGAFTYVPAAGYAGPDGFSYVARDAAGVSNIATVSITVTQVTTDTVTVKSATYTARKKLLAVEATSSAQPDAVLTVVGYGQMTYKTKTRTYTLQAASPSAPSSVTVTSNRGGSATKAVTVK